MHHFDLIEILAVGFSAALVLGFITNRLKLSPIVGYLLAGFLVGPHSPGFVADADLANQLAEVGVILLMFGVGLHFDLKDLMKVKGIAIPGAIAQSLVATVLVVIVARAFGFAFGSGLVLGLGVSVASTVVLLRVLEDNGVLNTVQGHVAVGWLIVEDIFTVLVLVILPPVAASLGTSGGESVNLGLALAVACLKLVVLAVLVLPLGGRVVPWFLGLAARTRSRELFTLAVLVVAFAIAAGSAYIFGASFALGAFLAGMVVGRSNVSHQAAAEVLPLRDAFAVLFFLSVGMIFNPAFLIERPGLILACLAVILIAKPLTALVVVIALGYSLRTALTVAIALGQIGEFSFILAQQAQSLGLMPPEGYSVLVACALISIMLNPLFFRLIEPLERIVKNRPALWRLVNRRQELTAESSNASTRAELSQAGSGALAIVAGYGPVGREVTSLLTRHRIKPVIVDLNIDTVRDLKESGNWAIFGDAGREEILVQAGIDRARYLFITVPDESSAAGAASCARNLSATIKIFVRARFVGSGSIFEALGVNAVCFEEQEVAKAMARLLIDEMNPVPPAN